MPIYEYACAACGALTEVLQKRGDPPPASCGTCGAESHLEKVVSRSAFHLKGGGWYAQGYSAGAPTKRDGNGAGENGAGDSPKSDSPKSDSPKSDSPKSDSPKSDTAKSDTAKSAAATPTDSA